MTHTYDDEQVAMNGVYPATPEKETPTPKTVEEVVDELHTELETWTSLNGFNPSDAEGIRLTQDWLRQTLLARDAAHEARLREVTSEILNNQKRIMAVATKDISPLAAEGAIVFVDIVTVDDIKQIATNHGTSNL